MGRLAWSQPCGKFSARLRQRAIRANLGPWGQGRLWTPSGVSGDSPRGSHSPGHLLCLCVPWDPGCLGSSLLPSWLQESFTEALLGCSTARQTCPLPEAHLGRPVLGFRSVDWHPLLRGEISPLSHTSSPCWPTGAMVFIDCRGAEQLLIHRSHLLPRGY